MFELRCVSLWLALLTVGILKEKVHASETSGVMHVAVDATNFSRNLLRAKLTIPVQAGEAKLVYPKWIQGEHGPTGPIVDLVGVKILADEKPLRWRRDDYDAHSFHLVVPQGVTTLTAEVEFLVSAEKTGFSRAASTTDFLGVLNWNQLILHPSGIPISELKITSSLDIPSGWKVGTALPVTQDKGSHVEFGAVSVETLCDSPVICGRYYKEIPIGPSGKTQHLLCMVADNPESLDITDDMKKALDSLIVEAHAIFGEPPYRSYRFLVTLSDHIGHYGMEHHESSDNRGPAGMLTDPLYRKTWHGWLMCHEFVHAWNGKYRRPTGMSPSDHQQVLRTDLLWVYEGLTQYYGLVLAARTGVWKPEIAQDNFARIAARATDQTGREWRSLEDTAIAGHYQFRAARSDGWYRRRGTDFYDEAAMVWLEADGLIREKSNGAKSLDDFCHIFYAGGGQDPRVSPYKFEDVVATLERVQPYDWKMFFENRVMRPNADPPIGGLTLGGWQLVFQKDPTDLYTSTQTDTEKIDLSSTLGLILLDDGQVEDVVPRSAADQAGVMSGMKLFAVNNRRWTPENVQQLISDTSTDSISLLFEKHDLFQTLVLKYSAGAKFPAIQRIEGQPDRLKEILSPRIKK